jgi:3-hydroxybutyrate dehydrogenase
MNILGGSDLSNRSVLVTGGAVNIGRGIVNSFLENGDKVGILDLDISHNVKEELEKTKPGSVLTYEGDVTDESFVKSVVNDMIKKWGSVDVLVNNAALFYKAPAEDIDITQWKRALDVNLTGPMICAKQVIPVMKRKKWGRIINIASMMSLIGAETYSPYAASKAGLLQLTKVWAIELARDSITVNAICPGWIGTSKKEAFLDKIAAVHGTNREDARDRLFALIPQRRFLDISEIASLALFLASDTARGINGAGIVIDTGITAGMPAGVQRKLE